jgi:hypothetical protein
MATHRALEAICSAIVTLLDDTAAADSNLGFDAGADFAVLAADDLSGMRAGAGILPYRITVNGTYRHPQGTRADDGRRHLPRLPVDLHYLVLVGIPPQETRLSLATWIMRTLEDHPVLPVGLLNRHTDAFSLDETVEVTFDDVPHEELLHLWEVLGRASYDALVLPYVTRSVLIESAVDRREHTEVQERLSRYGALAEVER